MFYDKYIYGIDVNSGLFFSKINSTPNAISLYENTKEKIYIESGSDVDIKSLCAINHNQLTSNIEIEIVTVNKGFVTTDNTKLYVYVPEKSKDKTQGEQNSLDRIKQLEDAMRILLKTVQ